VDAEVCLVDDAGQGQTVEEFHELVVYFLVVDFHSFGSEVVLLGHRAGLVVAPQQVHVVGVLQLYCHEQDHHLERLEAAVDVVAQENYLVIFFEGGRLQQLYK
jgi:hypothetical protein